MPNEGVPVRKTGLYALLIGGVLFSSGALAQQTTTPATTPDAAPQTAAPTEDPNEIVCHAGEPILGSRFPSQRVCHTRREWHQLQQDSQTALYHAQMERSANGGK
jgi:hypothetical protein